MKPEEIKKAVRERYGQVARKRGSCCGPAQGCGQDTPSQLDAGKQIGYSDDEMRSVPAEANMGLGCGNPTAFASLEPGETVLDLGSGGGLDCFLAAQKVGKTGKVIGVDMTPDMIDKARENAQKGHYGNVEFRLGEIEHLPAADSSIDVIISNCVINLAPDKGQVFKEAYRVLKTGGRMAISDLVLLKELPDAVRNNIRAYVGCIGGAIMLDEYKRLISNAGFEKIKVTTNKPEQPDDRELKKEIQKETSLSEDILDSLSKYVVSAYFEAQK